jgi:hypothetical protein
MIILWPSSFKFQGADSTTLEVPGFSNIQVKISYTLSDALKE